MDNSYRSPYDRPWRDVPPEVADILGQKLPELAQEVIEAAGVIPEYARPLEGKFGRNMRLGMSSTFEEFLALIVHGDEVEIAEEPHRYLGESEFHSGRSLDALQSLFRLGGRIAFQRISESASEAGLSEPVTRHLADALWAYVDRLAALAAEGYRRGQAEAAGSLAPARARLFEQLVEGPFEPGRFKQACAAARWRAPTQLATVIVDAPDLRPVVLRLDDSTLNGLVNGVGCIVMHDPEGPGRPELLKNALGERPAVAGPVMPPDQTAISLRLAQQAWALMLSGEMEADSPARVEDAYVTLLLSSDRELSAEIARSSLEPLDRLKPAQRERAAQTLRSWLRLRGDRKAVAAELNVHVQTVAYRMRQLRELFGDDLEDPEARFKLELGVRAHDLVQASQEPPPVAAGR